MILNRPSFFGVRCQDTALPSERPRREAGLKNVAPWHLMYFNHVNPVNPVENTSHVLDSRRSLVRSLFHVT